MRIKSAFRALAIIFALPAFICLAPPAIAQDEAQTVKSALMNCFSANSFQIPVASAPETIPPGLIEGQNVHVVSLPGTDGRAFSYEGARNDTTCGIAIYGPVLSSLQQEIRQLIDGDPRWKPHSPDAYKMSGVPAEETYWGDPRAPGLMGVLMLTRPPSPNAPTLEVEYHLILLH